MSAWGLSWALSWGLSWGRVLARVYDDRATRVVDVSSADFVVYVPED